MALRVHNVWAKFNDQPVGHVFFVPFSPVGQQYLPETQFFIQSALLIQTWMAIASALPGATTNAHKIKILPIFIFPPFLTHRFRRRFLFFVFPGFPGFFIAPRCRNKTVVYFRHTLTNTYK